MAIFTNMISLDTTKHQSSRFVVIFMIFFLATLDFVDNETNSILLVFIEDAVQINFNLLNDLV